VTSDFRFISGESVRRRELLHGRLWMDHPVTVVEDDGRHLAVLLKPGSPFSFYDHPFGPHPWSAQDCWSGPQVLQLHRADDLYSVWMFFTDDILSHWYINFEAPVVRQREGFDTDDYGLDLIVHLDGSTVWKDVDHLNRMRRSHRMTDGQVLDVLAAADEVSGLLGADQRWWSGWDRWTPQTDLQ